MKKLIDDIKKINLMLGSFEKKPTYKDKRKFSKIRNAIGRKKKRPTSKTD